MRLILYKRRLWLMLLLLAYLAFSGIGANCNNTLYPQDCRDLNETVFIEVDKLAKTFGQCDTAEECAYVAVVVPCVRELPIDAAILPDQYDNFRDAIIALNDEFCTVDNVEECNTHCDTGGGLYFPIRELTCHEGACIPIAETETSTGAISSLELCKPGDFVYTAKELMETAGTQN